ncbi:lantibiotic dehydratase [Chryseobacterium indologenes]|nr:lantibiotic dehydratase [Chryseobacterium indologenes]
MPRFPYQFFNEYMIRTPLFSYKKFYEKVGGEEVSDEELREIFNDKVFQEAIYLASPNLYEELSKYFSSEREVSAKEYQKLKNTILKYYSRMCTRCTPFGLFSNVSIGNFDDVVREISDHTDDLVRDTRLDMHFLVTLGQHFVKTQEIRQKLLFFPNSTIYKLGNKIRYIEYQYANGKREYIISSAPLSEELQQILEFSKAGKTIQQLSEILVNEEITWEDALDFLEELVDNQVLVSELEPNVSGIDFLEALLLVLHRIKADKEISLLLSVKQKIDEIDQEIGNHISKYHEIEKLLQSFEIQYDRKYLFQTDLYSNIKFTLPRIWKNELKKAVIFLNKIHQPQQGTTLEKFKKAFAKRYETREVSLSLALDTEAGIGYKQNSAIKGIHPYLEDVKISNSKKGQNSTIILNPIQKILNEKLQSALLESQYTIELSDEDFKDFEENWNNLPDTISFLAEIVSDNSQEKLFINSHTGSSAANFSGRFCSEKSKIEALTKAITKKEEELNPEYILAEIIHLPEARIGNVIRRPTLRQYEIPYLAQSVLNKENQISVDDLYISLKNDDIILRSKKLNKEVRPYLTNAHNYFTNSLPVYHFLSDLYSQNADPKLYFDWGSLDQIYKFLPRIEYNNIILSKARWKITEKDIAHLDAMIPDKNLFLAELKNWRTKRKIKPWIQWAKFDNTLTMNLENYDMAKLFIQTIKSEKSINIEEFLYNENCDFRYEFVFPMYKN